MSLASLFSDAQRAYLEVQRLEEGHGASCGLVQRAIRRLLNLRSAPNEVDDARTTAIVVGTKPGDERDSEVTLLAADAAEAPVNSLPGIVDLIKRENVFSSNETADDINTADLRYLLAHFYIGALLLKLVVARDDRLTLLRRARAHLSVFVGRCKQLGLFSDADADALERMHRGMTAQQKRDYKVERFRRQKATRAQLAALLERRQKRRTLRAAAKSSKQGDDEASNASQNSNSNNNNNSNNDTANDFFDDELDGGFGDESDWRRFELLQLDAALLDASEQLETAALEFDMLEQMAARRAAVGGSQALLDAELERARDVQRQREPMRDKPITIYPGQVLNCSFCVVLCCVVLVCC